MVTKNIKYKVPNGKFLEIQIEFDKYKIKDIKILGDFFIHPEKTIFDIEKSLKNNKISEEILFYEKIINKALKKNNAILIGMNSKDISNLIVRLIKNEI